MAMVAAMAKVTSMAMAEVMGSSQGDSISNSGSKSNIINNVRQQQQWTMAAAMAMETVT
jgi:ABC-type spermidine/putrescine transport system permease subunit I